MNTETRRPQARPDRVPAREVDPAVRVRNFAEVDRGYTADDAALEASRCLGCRRPLCVEACPVGVPIPRMVAHVANRSWQEALDTLHEANVLPSICGRVCPQESQCEGSCVLGRKGKPLAIGQIERFLGDHAADMAAVPEATEDATQQPSDSLAQQPAHTAAQQAQGIRVAIIGSGPAGITCAAELARAGVEVHMYDSLFEPGGVLMYGIPEFRLPSDVVAREVNVLTDLGVTIHTDTVAGRTVTVPELLDEQGFDAAFIGVGAGLPRLLNVPGESLAGVVCANEYLTRVNLMRAWDFPHTDTPVRRGKNVVVIGGGNVAMDAARTALRLGADSVTLAYRRTQNEMPARRAEVEHAMEEGVIILELASPLEFVAGQRGEVQAVRFQQMELSAPDADGRARPVPVEGSIIEVPCDLAITAIGTRACPLVPLMAPQVALNSRGYIEASEDGRTSDARIWAGGDIVTGAATVIQAMGAGKKSAKSILSALLPELFML